MTSHDTAEVESVAKGLTKAQREALVARTAIWTGRSEPATCWELVGRPLKVLRLIRFSTATGSITELTPLGVAARAHILERKSHDE